MWWYQAPRRIRQELWRIWRGHTRAAPLRHLVGRGLSLRRYGLRVMLSARNASSPARARRRWEFHRALVAAARRSPKASGWFRQDPVVAIGTQASNLRRLKALYIDCGEKDQFNLLYGVRRFVRRLNELGIAHRYEEFPDNHTSVDYRMDESLPFLAQALSG